MGACCSRTNNGGAGINNPARYRIIDGRRYHNMNSEYFVAGDEGEITRLRDNHLVMKHWSEGNFHAPVKENLKAGIRVLEIGCGPGAWILDMAQEYPKSRFIGIDLSPLFPTANLPENVTFIQMNLLDGLPYENETFDFVHQRLLVAAFTQAQWEEKVIRELARVTKEGGWIEFVDVDANWSSESPATQRVSMGLQTYMKSRGMNPAIIAETKVLCERSGFFSRVQQNFVTVPFGKRGGYWGELALKVIVEGMRAAKPYMAATLEIMPEEYDKLLETMMAEANVKKSSFLLYHVFGQRKHQKPF